MGTYEDLQAIVVGFGLEMHAEHVAHNGYTHHVRVDITRREAQPSEEARAAEAALCGWAAENPQPIRDAIRDIWRNKVFLARVKGDIVRLLDPEALRIAIAERRA